MLKQWKQKMLKQWKQKTIAEKLEALQDEFGEILVDLNEQSLDADQARCAFNGRNAHERIHTIVKDVARALNIRRH